MVRRKGLLTKKMRGTDMQETILDELIREALGRTDLEDLDWAILRKEWEGRQ